MFRSQALVQAALLIAALSLAISAPTLTRAAVVRKADDTSITGPLVALENGEVVLEVTTDGKTKRVATPLADVVEMKFDRDADVRKQPTTGPTTKASVDKTIRGEAAVTSKAPRLFDGSTLEGWEGETDVWSASDGMIVGKVDETVRNSRVTYLTYTKEEFDDFQISYSFRITGGVKSSSGLQFRSQVVEKDGFKDVNGYQQELGRPRGLTGALVDSAANGNGKPVRAEIGERAVYDANGERKVVALGLPAPQLHSIYQPGEWNDATLVVRGNHMVSLINGQIFSEVINDVEKASKKGVIAFQISRRQLMTVEIKDLAIRKLASNELPRVKGVDWGKLLNENAIVVSTSAPAPTEIADATSQPASAASAATKPSRTAHPWKVKLLNGDQLTGRLLAWDHKQFKLQTAHGELSVPTNQLREVWYASDADVAKARAAAATSGAAATEDVAFARKDDTVVPVAGLVLGADTKSLKFRFRDQERTILFDKLIGATFAAGVDEAVDDSLRQSFTLSSGGDVISGKWTALDNGVITLATSAGASLKLPVRSLEFMRTKNGRLVYLSDLPPVQVEQTPYFDRLLPYRLDTSLTGTPIKLAGSEHARGISVHSRTILRYDIGRRFEKFKCKLGFQQPEGKLGRAAVRVLGDDGKVLHEVADARGDQPPGEIDLSVAGVSRLTLEVDFGADQDVGDRVVWAEARLIRATSAK